jgi:hypothetical protein
LLHLSEDIENKSRNEVYIRLIFGILFFLKEYTHIF